MWERMSAADMSFLRRESPNAPQHVGELAVFDSGSHGLDYEKLVRLIEERIPFAPRYRQKVRVVPANLANPMWVDDPQFDITYHVRRSALPRPGTDDQLLAFCGRIQSRLLDRGRPLWEMYLVEGMAGGRAAIVTKTHEALINEQGLDLAQVILDAAPEPRRAVEAIWMPESEPSSAQLVRGAAREALRRPLGTAGAARGIAQGLHGRVSRTVAARAGGVVADGLLSAAGAVLRRPAASPLMVDLCEGRRVAVARTQLRDYRAVREAFGGSVNDVVLAVVAGALRGWLLSRAQPLRSGNTVRALVPMSVVDARPATDDTGLSEALGAAQDGSSVGSLRPAAQVNPVLLDLPVGEPDAVLRLAQLRYAMASHAASDRALRAERLVPLSGFAPATLHARAARAAGGITRRLFNIVITNVPGPQLALYAAGARMTEMFPILPLSEGHALAIGLTSYDGGVFFGVNADRDAVRDVEVLSELLEESLAELVSAANARVAGTSGARFGSTRYLRERERP